jgi:hypothetical protein
VVGAEDFCVHGKEKNMSNQPENENQQFTAPEELRLSLLASIEASKQEVAELSDEDLMEIAGGAGIPQEIKNRLKFAATFTAACCSTAVIGGYAASHGNPHVTGLAAAGGAAVGLLGGAATMLAPSRNEYVIPTPRPTPTPTPGATPTPTPGPHHV